MDACPRGRARLALRVARSVATDLADQFDGLATVGPIADTATVAFTLGVVAENRDAVRERLRQVAELARGTSKPRRP